MVDHRKIYRVFNLISRLRSPFGATKTALARDFDVSERTIERYLVLLQDLGFDVTKRANRFRIECVGKHQVTPEDLIVFSLEEAAAIKDAITNSPLRGPLQKSLLTKLYALTDIDEISDTLYRQNISKNISSIRRAIKSKEQLILKSYHSVSSSKTSDRLIEPIKFFSYYTYLLAFEVNSQMVKQFKIDRIEGVHAAGYRWQFEEKHGQSRIDAFGMSGTEPKPVNLKLSMRAHHLMEEEFPDTVNDIHIVDDGAIYDGAVYSFEGIGRFIMGLLDEVVVVKPEGLKVYIDERITKWHEQTSK
jgi:predicted DNA-binding transcriptional regulator YafY